jgi:site-specific DNA-methyltransferase (adenine-specific)
MVGDQVRGVLDGHRQWAAVLGDSAEVLREMAGGEVAHVITDPPYDQRTHAGARTDRGTNSDTAEFGIGFAPIVPAEVAPLLLRVASRWVIAFCALEQLGAYQEAAGTSWIRAGVWDRVDPSPQLTGDRPGQACDGIAIMHRPGRKRWNGGGSAAIWRASTPRGDKRPEHPTPKPLPVLLDMVRRFTDPGDVVLDPYMGSGTTGVACLLLGRRFIGVEIDERYHAVAVERLRQAEIDARGGALFAQLPLGGG